MLGVEDYGSDNDSDHESPQKAPTPSPKKSLPQTNSHSTLLNLPPPKSKRAPKKITIALPDLPNGSDDDVDAEKPPAKKPRLTLGAGSSSLLGMLPAPKQKLPTLPGPPSERMLGAGRGPGLVFNASRPPVTVPSTLPLLEREEEGDDANPVELPLPSEEDALVETSSQIPFDPASTPVKPLLSSALATSTFASTPSLFNFSSAPAVEEFTPPEPSQTDPYPGYYLLPSGSWAAYDPTYYQSFYKKWEKEYNSQIRAFEKGMAKGFEGLETSEAQDVDAKKEMEKAKKEIQDREEKKAVTYGAAGAPAEPRMNIKGAKLGARARSRHQLSTLLNEAYQNRDALEEKIAEGRRNRKEAGNKYGE